MKADGFDDAIIGVGYRCGQDEVLVYDRDMCIHILVREGMSYDEAVEYFEFNVEGAWVGDKTPMFVQRFNNLEEIVDAYAE
jgi:hypothetical protein